MVVTNPNVLMYINNKRPVPYVPHFHVLYFLVNVNTVAPPWLRPTPLIAITPIPPHSPFRTHHTPPPISSGQQPPA